MIRRKIIRQEETADESFLNLTPLIDVVLVVLVSFVLIAPLIEIDKVSLAPGLARSFDASTMQKSPINIYVKEDNTISFNAKKVSLEELKGELKYMKISSPNEVPKLFQDQKSSFGSYQAVKNIVEEAGFERLDVILKSK